jgi:hypothetical protein
MIADRNHLERWRQLLSVQEIPIRPIDVIRNEMEVRKGRHFLTAAVAAAAVIRRGESIAISWNSPEIPVRRPAAEGAAVADLVWRAYLRTLQPTALVFTVSDNPEPWWQNEMIILHALHSYALQSGNTRVLAKTLECADFHLREIQPDHATNEPWSVHAYASHPDGNVTAETLWHAAHIQHAGRPGPVATLLAHDAASALATYLQS